MSYEKSKTTDIYMWTEEDGWVGVYGLDGPVWTSWLDGQSASGRERRTNLHTYRAYWSFHPSWLENLAVRFAQLDVVPKKGKPDHFGIMQNIFDRSPYEELYVSSTAPKEVVSASHKALSKKNHPDFFLSKGQSIVSEQKEKMQKLNTAKDKIYEEKGWK